MTMDPELPLEAHLEELRRRVLVAVVALFAGSFLAFPFASLVLKVLKAPGHGLIEQLAYFSPQEAFMVYLKIALFCGLFIALPVILYEVWAFVSPAMEEKLRRYTLRFVFFSFLAFCLGGLFAYFILIPAALNFLLNFARGELEPVISVDRYISFVGGFILACGLVFEMPVLSYIFSRAGILKAQFLRSRYKYAVLLIFIFAAVITPTTDIFNLFILAVPMLLLYEVSVWVSYLSGARS